MTEIFPIKCQKRNGKKVPFNFSKIVSAVEKSYEAVGEEFDVHVLDGLEETFKNKKTWKVDDIQDSVENWLIEHASNKAAKNYIVYKDREKNYKFINDRLDYMIKYADENNNAATASETDANANVTIKNVSTLETEVWKTQNRQVQRTRMRKQLQKQFPEVADQYEKDINHHIIYINDEASSPALKYYCQAITLYPLLIDGTSTMDGLKTTAPSNLSSFIGQLNNLIFLLSSQCKGAVGVGELWNFFDYFCLKEFGEDYHKRLDEVVTAPSVPCQKTIKKKIEDCFQQFVYSINQPAGNRGFQSPFVNVNYFDKFYWNSLFKDFQFPDGTKPVWERVSVIQKMFMKWFNNERSKTLLTFPVESMALLNDGNDIMDKDYKEFTAEMWSEGHSFFCYTSSDADSLSSCCRLRNSLSSNTFSSLGGLTGVQTGSCSVMTLNISRIVQDWSNGYDVNPDEVKFFDYLGQILDRVYKYQIAFKTMLYDMEKKKMFSSCNAGYISMKKLFCTIGLNGHNEAAEFLGYKIGINNRYIDFMVELCGYIEQQNKEHSTPKFTFNLEMVPAEGLGPKNYKWDKEDGYWVPEDRNLYNSYNFLQNDGSLSVTDKMKLHGGKISDACSGGQAAHINLDEHLTKDQYLRLIDVAVKEHCSYFTFNIPNSQCSDCGHIEKQHFDECRVCHSHNIVDWTRIIGFLRPVSSFSKERFMESQTRVYNHKI